MKSVLIIAIVVVAMIGVMVPNISAEETVEIPFIFEVRENDWTTGGIGTGNSVFLIITGDLQDKGFTKFSINGLFQASIPMTLEEKMYLTKGNTENWINFDWQYRPGEEYTLTAINGDYSTSVTWLPNPTSTTSQGSNDSFSTPYPEITSSKIIISGETNPVVKKGMVSLFPYQVEIIGELEYNPSIRDNGGWLERCQDNPIDVSGSNRCATSDKVFLISETSRIFEFEKDFGYYWELDDQFREYNYDPKPKGIEIMFRFGDELSSFNVYPDWQDIPSDHTLSQESIEKIHTRSISIKATLPASMDERWLTLLEICSGENSLVKPSVVISSDIETTYYILPISVNELSCTQQEIQVKAIDPETIDFRFETAEVVNDEEIDQLKKEIEELKEMMLEKQQESETELDIIEVEEAVVEEAVVAPQESSEEGGGCLIATATYGSELAPQVQQLRELRDNQLLQTQSGTAFMGTFNDIYYSFSPMIADYERENPLFKEAVKLAITPMISSLSLMENAESESEVLGIGLSVIMLNLGMYFGVPAIVIVGIRKKF